MSPNAQNVHRGPSPMHKKCAEHISALFVFMQYSAVLRLHHAAHSAAHAGCCCRIGLLGFVSHDGLCGKQH